MCCTYLFNWQKFGCIWHMWCLLTSYMPSRAWNNNNIWLLLVNNNKKEESFDLGEHNEEQPLKKYFTTRLVLASYCNKLSSRSYLKKDGLLYHYYKLFKLTFSPVNVVLCKDDVFKNGQIIFNITWIIKFSWSHGYPFLSIFCAYFVIWI